MLTVVSLTVTSIFSLSITPPAQPDAHYLITNASTGPLSPTHARRLDTTLAAFRTDFGANFAISLEAPTDQAAHSDSLDLMLTLLGRAHFPSVSDSPLFLRTISRNRPDRVPTHHHPIFSRAGFKTAPLSF